MVIRISPKTKPAVNPIKIKPINHRIVSKSCFYAITCSEPSPRTRNIQTNAKRLINRDFGTFCKISKM